MWQIVKWCVCCDAPQCPLVSSPRSVTPTPSYHGIPRQPVSVSHTDIGIFSRARLLQSRLVSYYEIWIRLGHTQRVLRGLVIKYNPAGFLIYFGVIKGGTNSWYKSGIVVVVVFYVFPFRRGMTKAVLSLFASWNCNLFTCWIFWFLLLRIFNIV